jgi:outer membrane protein assembly factor BamB
MHFAIRHPAVLFASLLFVALSGPLQAQSASWPGWRGANRDDHSPDKGLLKKWGPDGPKLAWIFKDAGVGYSGPAVVGGKLYTLGARNDAEQLICLDAQTGKELWFAEIGPVLGNGWGDGPRSTPTVDGALVYAMSGKGTLAAVDAASGKIAWKKNMEKDLKGKLPGWGYTESVLVDGEKVICTPGGPGGAMAALNKKTGDVLWQSSELAEEAWYSSPVVAQINGKRQYVQMVHGNVFGADAENGKILWKTDWRGKVAAIPTPIVVKNSVYITSGYGVGCKKVTIKPDWSVDVDYDVESDTMSNHHGGVILVEGKLFGHSDQTGWSCQDFATGKIDWKASKLGKGAVGYADGMLFCVAEDDGAVVLAEASKTGWKESGRFKLSPQTNKRKKDGRIWTHPVILNGRLYLRDQDLIYCFNVKN